MARKAGYYRVKKDGTWIIRSFNGESWYEIERIWIDGDTEVEDSYFEEINEERIPMPGDAVSKVVVLPAGVTAAQWVEITERMNGFAWLWAETTFRPKTDPKLTMGNNVIPRMSKKAYEESIINYHERVFVYEVLGKIFNPINDRFVSAELSSSWGNCLICIKKHDGSEVKIDLLALYNVKFIITGQDIYANPKLLTDKLNELLPVVDETQPVERVLPEQPDFTPYHIQMITPENANTYLDAEPVVVNGALTTGDKVLADFEDLLLKPIEAAHVTALQCAMRSGEVHRKEVEKYVGVQIYYCGKRISPDGYRFIGDLHASTGEVHLYVKEGSVM